MGLIVSRNTRVKLGRLTGSVLAMPAATVRETLALRVHDLTLDAAVRPTNRADQPPTADFWWSCAPGLIVWITGGPSDVSADDLCLRSVAGAREFGVPLAGFVFPDDARGLARPQLLAGRPPRRAEGRIMARKRLGIGPTRWSIGLSSHCSYWAFRSCSKLIPTAIPPSQGGRIRGFYMAILPAINAHAS